MLFQTNDADTITKKYSEQSERMRHLVVNSVFDRGGNKKDRN